jgi:hypothetical protein
MDQLLESAKELPACMCGKQMKVFKVTRLAEHTDSHIRVYKCATCQHEMRLTVWTDSALA